MDSLFRVPWWLCSVFFAGALGVGTLEYLSYAFLCYLTPLVAIADAITGKFIWKGDVAKNVTIDGTK